MFVLRFNRDLRTRCIKESLGHQTLQKNNVFPSHFETAFLAKDSIAFEKMHLFTAQPYHMKIFRRRGERDKKTLLKEKTKYEMQDVGYQNWTLTAEIWMLLKLSRAENCNKTEIYMYINAHPLSTASSLEVLTCSWDSDKPRGEMLCFAIRGEIIPEKLNQVR